RPVVLADFADPGTPERSGIGALELMSSVDEVTSGSGYSEASVVAGGVERESYGQILSVLLGITVGLLAVAVLVALVGVANTLSLGVIERTGENALMRALGTTRRQMQAMLGWEGVLLALVGAVLGLVLGSVYGVLGINALLGSTYPVSITMPWIQLALVLVLAVAAGAVASVVPGRAAGRTAAAAALAGAAWSRDGAGDRARCRAGRAPHRSAPMRGPSRAGRGLLSALRRAAGWSAPGVSAARTPPLPAAARALPASTGPRAAGSPRSGPGTAAR